MRKYAVLGDLQDAISEGHIGSKIPSFNSLNPSSALQSQTAEKEGRGVARLLLLLRHRLLLLFSPCGHWGKKRGEGKQQSLRGEGRGGGLSEGTWEEGRKRRRSRWNDDDYSPSSSSSFLTRPPSFRLERGARAASFAFAEEEEGGAPPPPSLRTTVLPPSVRPSLQCPPRPLPVRTCDFSAPANTHMVLQAATVLEEGKGMIKIK